MQTSKQNVASEHTHSACALMHTWLRSLSPELETDDSLALGRQLHAQGGWWRRAAKVRPGSGLEALGQQPLGSKKPQRSARRLGSKQLAVLEDRIQGARAPEAPSKGQV